MNSLKLQLLNIFNWVYSTGFIIQWNGINEWNDLTEFISSIQFDHFISYFNSFND